MVSHVDGSLADLARNKLLSMFNNVGARVAVGKKESGNDTMAMGLLGNDDKVRARLAKVSKADELVMKNIIGGLVNGLISG